MYVLYLNNVTCLYPTLDSYDQRLGLDRLSNIFNTTLNLPQFFFPIVKLANNEYNNLQLLPDNYFFQKNCQPQNNPTRFRTIQYRLSFQLFIFSFYLTIGKEYVHSIIVFLYTYNLCMHIQICLAKNNLKLTFLLKKNPISNLVKRRQSNGW